MNDQLLETQVSLGNATELALAIVRGTLGNENSTSVGEINLATTSVCISLIQTRLQSNLSNFLGAK